MQILHNRAFLHISPGNSLSTVSAALYSSVSNSAQVFNNISTDVAIHTTNNNTIMRVTYKCNNRPGHSKFFFSGQENCKISGHFSGHQNHVFKLK